MVVKTEKFEFDPENLVVSAKISILYVLFKIPVRTLTLHRCVIPTVNPDVSIFIERIR